MAESKDMDEHVYIMMRNSVDFKMPAEGGYNEVRAMGVLIEGHFYRFPRKLVYRICSGKQAVEVPNHSFEALNVKFQDRPHTQAEATAWAKAREEERQEKLMVEQERQNGARTSVTERILQQQAEAALKAEQREQLMLQMLASMQQQLASASSEPSPVVPEAEPAPKVSVEVIEEPEAAAQATDTVLTPTATTSKKPKKVRS